jgi:hypothetical protein
MTWSLWTLVLACTPDAPAPDAPETTAPVDCSEAIDAPLVDVHDGDVSDTYGVMFSDGDELVMVFESATPDFSTSALRVARSADGRVWDPSEPQPGPDLPFVGGPTYGSIEGVPWLYTIGGASAFGEAQVHRTDIATGEVQPVDAPGTEAVLDWPYVHVHGPDSVWMATLEDGRRVVAHSEDGVRFDVVGDLGPSRPQFSLHTFADGTLAAVWQTGIDPQQVYVQLSDDGTSWGEQVLASEVSNNVHDGRFVRRADGDLDLYYIAALRDVAGFSVYRRYVGPDGHLGPEERLTFPDDGNVNKPSPHRLDPCRVGLTVSRVVDPNQGWWVAHAASLVLAGDADPGR